MKKGGENKNMKLLTKELLKRFEQVGNQENAADPIVIAKFFNPAGAGTWYATEFNTIEENFFGYVTGLGTNELGYFNLKEMEDFRSKFGTGIERDRYFTEMKLSEVKRL